MRRGSVRRAMLAVTTMAVALVVPVGSAAEPPQSPTDVAHATGQRVEVPERGTETSQVFANPNGTFTVEQHVLPTRVRRGKGWVPVDRKLTARPDGTVSPAATSTPLTFSGGGTTPFARFGDEQRQLTLRWPGVLPKPALAGDTATYPEVLPGIDLRVQAKPLGFAHVLVIRTPEAARNPALARLTFGMETKGVTVRTDKQGALIATDKSGKVAFQAPPPQMWDSGELKVTMPVEVGTDSLTLIPDQKLLTDPRARFPIEIDPDWSSGKSAWAMVYEQHPEDHYWGGDGSPYAKVGYSGNWEPKTVKVRSYFQFDVWALSGKDIVSAEFNIFQNHAASCTQTGTSLGQTWPITPGTSWNSPPGWVRGFGTYGGSYGRSGCLGKSIGFNVRDAVADPRNGQATFVLTTDEGDQNAWRKFDPNSPALIVTYNDLPNQPWGLSIHGRECNGNDPHIATATPVLRASAGDPNGGLVQADFEWFVRGGGIISSYRSPTQDSNTQFSMTIPAGHYADGAGIAWRVRAWDGRAWGPWSIWCGATVDMTKPDRPPTVSSTTYPENGEGGSPGRTGEFTLDANGVTDVAEFKYRLSGHEEKSVPATNGTVKVYLTPPTADPYTLEVTSVDRAGNRAIQENTRKYQFRVGLPTKPVGHWPLDGYHTTTVAPDAARDHDATVSAIGPALWKKGRIGDALQLNGSSGYAATSAPSVYTAASFTVSAWVKLDRAADLWYSAVTQEGNYVPGFALQYAGNVRSWSFSMLTDDVLNPTVEQAYDPKPPVVGQWTHLTGVYNSSERRMSLYVNGSLAMSTTRTGRNWHATGGVQIGRGEWNGNVGDYWPGAIDDVKMYDRALPDVAMAGPTEVDKAAIQPAANEAIWAFDERTGTGSTDVSGHYREGRFTGSPVWTAGKVGSGAIKLDGDDYVEASGPVLRTDNSYTVSAWARPDPLTPGTLVSQDGGNGASGFYLQYRSDMNAWVFTVPTNDSAIPGTVYVKDSAPPLSGWSHVAGVYDASVAEIRLYVNGAMAGRTPVPGGIRWSAPGPLAIGRAKWNNQLGDFWKGWIDEVQLHTGVRTDDEIRNEFLKPAGVRKNDNGLGRYVNADGDHFFTNGPVPAGYRLEGQLGWLAPPGAPGTRQIYSCLVNKDEFTSIDPGCEGSRRLAEIGSLYVDPPAGMPSHAIYRCRVGSGDHFASVMPDCEGHTNESRLGYALPYKMLHRNLLQAGPADNSSDTGLLPPSYQRQRALGGLATSQLPGTRELVQCLYHWDRFTSTDPKCEGQTVVGRIGWIWTAPPDGLDTVPLYRCVIPGGEHFDSTDPDCEGKQTEFALGYVLRGVTG